MKKFLKKLIGFSLIELMISLITISCITAAFTPVITKRLANSSLSVNLDNLSTKCTDKFGSYCTLCDKKRCLSCYISCANNQFKDSNNCKCGDCSSKGAGCAICNTTNCISCKEGYGYNSSNHTCSLCPAGQYSDGSSPCKKCPKGQYQPSAGKGACIKANPGYYVPSEGAAAQSPCPQGKYQAYEGKDSCSSCLAGYAQPLTGQSSCNECGLGYYQPNGGQANCLECNVGYYSGTGAKTSCTKCPKGTYQDTKHQSSCKKCAAGTYSAAEGATSVSTCTKCNQGTWSSAEGATSVNTCTKCAAGKYSTAYGATNINTCSDCAAGRYSAAGASGCTNCNAGQWSDNGASSCYSCPIGYACSAGTKTSCTDGKYALKGYSSCALCKNKITKCTACYADSNQNVKCTGCDTGYHVVNNQCVVIFSSGEYKTAGTYNWVVPSGVTKIEVVAIGGGFSGASGTTLDGNSKEFSADAILDLSSNEYKNLKNRTIKVEGCGAGGSAGEPSILNGENSTCLTKYYVSHHYCTNLTRPGGLGGQMSCNLAVDGNAASLSIKVGKVNEGEEGKAGETKVKSGWGTAISGGGGKGGGASYVTDGKGHFCAAGGGGGSAGSYAVTPGSPGAEAFGGAGGNGQGYNGSYGGAGGVGRDQLLPEAKCGTEAFNPINGGVCYLGHQGEPGTSNSGGSFSKTGYCGSGQNGYIKISWAAVNETGNGGASGKCNTQTINVTAGTTCSVVVGGSDNNSYVTCGSTTVNSSSGTSQHAASGSTGGSGFGTSCSASGTYGKGGSGTNTTTVNAGNGGYIKITNKT